MATHVIHTHHHSGPDYNSDVYNATHALSRYLVPLGRLFFSAIFLLSAPMHFTHGMIAAAADHGVPMAQYAVPLSGVLALLGGLSVLLGYRVRLGAFLLVVFLVPVTLMMHNFWTIDDAQQAMMQRAMFMKNVAILGGALLLSYFGAGPYSLDSRAQR